MKRQWTNTYAKIVKPHVFLLKLKRNVGHIVVGRFCKRHSFCNADRVGFIVD